MLAQEIHQTVSPCKRVGSGTRLGQRDMAGDMAGDKAGDETGDNTEGTLEQPQERDDKEVGCSGECLREPPHTPV